MRHMKRMRTGGFRANDAAEAGREWAVDYYSRKFKDPLERSRAASYIESLIEKFGPVVDGYPSWHPFTSVSVRNTEIFDPKSDPQGFDGLDHSIYFRDAFITAPYNGSEKVVESAIRKENESLMAEEIQDIELYYYGAKPVLITCDTIPKEDDGTILKRYAIGRMLSHEVPSWRLATCGESWESMRRHILGTPCGSRSSLFVNQNTGQALREVYELLNRHELFGPTHY